MSHRLPSVLAILLTVPCAFAQTRYVDAVSGLDTNDGLTPASAWRTLTFATTTPSDVFTISIAPGTHDAALGEVFPISVPPGVVLSGSPVDAERPVIDAGGAPVAVELTGTTFGGVFSAVIQDAGVGVRSSNSDVRLTRLLVRDCRLGIQIDSQLEEVRGNLTRLVVRDCVEGISVTGFVELRLSESLVEEIEGVGVRYAFDSFGTSGGFGWRQLQLDRSRVDRCGGVAVDLSFVAPETPGIWVDELQASRSGIGMRLRVSTPTPPASQLFIEQSTFAANAIGLAIDSIETVEIETSVLDSNGLDVADVQGAAVTDESHVSDGSLPAASTGDAFLVDPANGDLRPAFGSPLIDRGTSAGVGVRDGDLDQLAFRDWGAIELDLLSGPKIVPLGGFATFEVFGPSGAMVVGISGRPGAELDTRYGTLQMLPQSIGRQSQFMIEPGRAPTTWVIPVPKEPLFVGSYAVQALIETSNLAPGAGLTPVAFYLVTP